MTHFEWAEVLLTILGGVLAIFAWAWNEARIAKNTARKGRDDLAAALTAKIDLLEGKNSTSLYNVKKDILESLDKEKKSIADRVDRIEHQHEASQAEFTAKLETIVEMFTRTCDGLQSKLEHMTATIIGQYVPRQEIDAKFNRMEEKQDRMLTILYDMKK